MPLLLPSYRTQEFEINAFYPHRRHLSAKVRAFIDMLITWFVEQSTGSDQAEAKVCSRASAGMATPEAKVCSGGISSRLRDRSKR